MEMKQCPNGHFYYPSKTQECPHCTSASANINVTRPGGVGETVAVNQPPFMDHTRQQPAAPDRNLTKAVIQQEIGIDPVVGWLVCVEGKDKGRDYRIHADNNYIGRGEQMDICIRGDDTISRENHAVICCDLEGKTFYFAQGTGRGMVRLNDKPVLSTVLLAPYDHIKLGNTFLVFMPFCGEAFNWI